jgi:hypothetical protein
VTSESSWWRVSRAHPCPVCGKRDWCLLTGPGRDPKAAICARTESPKRCGEAGWLHRLRDDDDQHHHHHVRVVRFATGAAPRERLAHLAAQYRQDLDPGRLHQLATSLGLSVASLCHLGIGWSTRRIAPGPSR